MQLFLVILHDDKTDVHKKFIKMTYKIKIKILLFYINLKQLEITIYDTSVIKYTFKIYFKYIMKMFHQFYLYFS